MTGQHAIRFVRGYARVMRLIRAFLGYVNLWGVIDNWGRKSRPGLWFRSLFAVHDLDDFVALDVPWWTFDSTRMVDGFLASRPQARVFEWGSGASTVWLAKRSAEVVTVEYDPHWAERVQRLVPPHVTVHLCPVGPAANLPGEARSRRMGYRHLDFTAYVDVIDTVPGRFDLIVIDGRARTRCLQKAITRLAPDGLIVLDNVGRRRYRDALAGLGERIAIHWTGGATPTLPWPTETALIRLTPLAAGVRAVPERRTASR